jgi:hypothetical protein
MTHEERRILIFYGVKHVRASYEAARIRARLRAKAAKKPA